MRTLVIGYGNPLRGDDALGWRAAEYIVMLRDTEKCPPVAVETFHQLTPEAAASIAGADLVIFLDACVPSAQNPPGSVSFEEIEAGLPCPGALDHHMTAQQALAYAAVLFDAHPRAFAGTVAAQSFDYGSTLTPAVKAAIPTLISHVLWAIHSQHDGALAGAGRS